jgi:chromosome segregation ATPase
MTLLQQDIQRLAADNERLRSDLASTQDQCQQEYLRAQEAEQVAAESETVRNNLLSSYGRLTQENVDLHREKEDNDAEKARLSKDLASMNEELNALRKQSSHNLKQLHVSYKEKKELERLLDCANVQLEKQKNAIQAANEDRQRIQDELHSSRRSAAAASEQLIKLRDEFTKKLQDDRNSKAKDSLVAKKLEEEQTRRAELEELVSRAKGKEDSAEEVSRKLARSNAELRSQVNQLIARMNYSTETFESDAIVEDCAKDAPDEKGDDNLSCYF